MIALFLVVFVIGVAHGQIQTLDATVTGKYDIEARREILIRILVKLNDTVKAQIAASTGCEEKLNQTVDECNVCKLKLCQQSPPITTVLLQTLQAGANVPVVYAGKVVNDAAAWFQNGGKFLGGRAAEYSRTLGSTAKTIGNTLERTGQQMLAGMANEFNNLGTQFEKTANTIQNEVINPLANTYLGLSNSFSNLENVMSSALSGTENAFNSVINSLENVGSDIGNFFKDLFSKKRALLMRDEPCVQSCPVCDKLDKKKYTMKQILGKVCGAEAVSKQDQATADIQWLQAHSNYTYTGQNVTKTDANQATFKVVNFATLTFTFDEAWFYTDDGVKRKYPGVMYMNDHEQTGKKMGEIYFQDRWTKRS